METQAGYLLCITNPRVCIRIGVGLYIDRFFCLGRQPISTAAPHNNAHHLSSLNTDEGLLRSKSSVRSTTSGVLPCCPIPAAPSMEASCTAVGDGRKHRATAKYGQKVVISDYSSYQQPSQYNLRGRFVCFACARAYQVDLSKVCA